MTQDETGTGDAKGAGTEAHSGARVAPGRALGLTAAIAVVLVGIAAVVWLNPRQMTREQYLALDYFPMERPIALEPFRLTTHTGAPFVLDSLEGHWNLLYFGYTYCPDVCPTTLALLNSVVKKIAADGNPAEPQVFLISVDPERDTPDRLADYVTFFNPGFVGVTGELAEVTNLAQQLYVPFGKVPGGSGDDYLVDHGANVIVIDPRGQYAGFFRPPLEPEHLLEVLTSLLRR